MKKLVISYDTIRVAYSGDRSFLRSDVAVFDDTQSVGELISKIEELRQNDASNIRICGIHTEPPCPR